jgi:hypothetical protein
MNQTTPLRSYLNLKKFCETALSMPYLDTTATISEAKLTKYLLIQQPKDDKSGFLAQAGYTLENWQKLQQELKRLLLNEATLNKETNFGEIYEIKGILIGVNGVNL